MNKYEGELKKLYCNLGRQFVRIFVNKLQFVHLFFVVKPTRLTSLLFCITNDFIGIITRLLMTALNMPQNMGKFHSITINEYQYYDN